METINYHGDYITLKEDEYFDREKDAILCSKCNTKRYVISPAEDVFACKCACQTKEIEEREKEKQQARIREYLEEMKKKSLLGERYKNKTFENVEIINDEHKRIIERLKTYISKFNESNKGQGIYLYGKSGSGKTLLTACMVNEFINNYIQCVFINVAKIKQTLLKNTKQQENFMQYLYNIPVLIIDDFATENVKKNGEDNWVQEIVYDIINTRYNNMKPIIYTSNYSMNKLVEERGILEKTVDRIYESSVQIKIDLPDYRVRDKEESYF